MSNPEGHDSSAPRPDEADANAPRRSDAPRHHNGTRSVPRWVVFVTCIVVLSLVTWILWTRVISPADNTKRQDAGSTVSIAVGDIPQSLDPATAPASKYLVGNVYETLLSRDDDNNPAAGIATSWDESSDGLTYTFTVGNGITFSNGDALDASDVVWSLQNIIQNGQGSALGSVASVSNTDATTLTITLAQPNQTLLWQLTGSAGIVWDQESPDSPIGSGPYTVGGFAPGASLQLKPNASYWNRGEDSNVPPSVTLVAYSDGQTAVDDLKAGTIQGILPVDDSLASTLDGADGITTTTMQSTIKVAIALHSGGESYFADPAVRESFRMALDEDSIVKALGIPFTRLSGPIAPLDPGYEELADAWGFDPTGSQRCFTHIRRRTIEFVYRSSDSALADQITANLTSSSWAVTPTELSDADYEQRVVTDRDYDATITTFDGSRDLDAISEPGNIADYTNSDADTERAALDAATSDEDYAADAKALATTINNDSSYDWLYVRTPIAAFANGLSGAPALYSTDRVDLSGLRMA